ncbi:MAG TPA: hypothetical protein VK911_07580 [Vicinamibacterales bacterium]|nr:hypothetical protein [Vicinamibacterales bacterium]
MKIPAWLGAVLALTVLAPPQPAFVGAQDASFALAVLRQDGIVIPFAHFDGRRWRNRWPVAGKGFPVPLRIADVPGGWWPDGDPITAWTAWRRQGPPVEVTSQAPVSLLIQCQRGLGIRTSYSAAEKPPDVVQPYPKDGLATAGAVVVEQPRLIEASSSEWRAVDAAVQREVRDLEDKAVKRFVGAWVHPTPRAQRDKQPFTPEVIMAVTPRAFYFEGVKTYPPAPLAPGEGWRRMAKPRNACNMLTYAAGWVLLDDKGRPTVRASADITDCNREGLVYSLPLGLIRHDDRVFWVVQVSGWGYERYEVMEVRGDEVRSAIATPGGWCG